MDVIPFFKFVAAIFLGGLTFYFFSLFLAGLMGMLPITSIYFNAMLAIFSGIPAVILFRSGIRLVMHMQKRRM